MNSLQQPSKASPQRQFSEMKWLRYVQEAAIPREDPFTDYRLTIRKAPIASGEIPGYSHFVNQGKAIGKRGRDGVASSMARINVDSKVTMAVEEQEFAFASPKHMPGSRYLVTYGLQTCVAIAAYNPDWSVGMLAHAFEQVNAFDALEKAIGFMEAKEVVLFGGWPSSNVSKETIYMAEALLAQCNKVRIIGRDTLRSDHPTSIGLDTSTGEIFMPSNRAEYKGTGCYVLRPSQILNFSSGVHTFYQASTRSVPVATQIEENMKLARM